MIKKHFVAGLLCIAFQAASAQQDSVIAVKSYSFLILDRPAQLSTMRQFDQNYLSLYRLYSDQLHKHFNKKVAFGIQMLSSVLTVPLSHEEGHRSVLTYKNIGSVSKPYFNSKGAAYVVGVRDSELQQLRDTDLPTYIRVHTAGAESDYMVSLASERLLTFGEEDYRTIGVEYLFRKISTFSYYFTSMFKRFSPNLKEETNELKRDIVGHDMYGAVRHLHRPEMLFYRYTDYEDLTSEERKFIRRVGYRSIFTLLNPQFIGKKNFTLSSTVKANIGFGYLITPFGDMIDNNIWIMYNSDLKLLVQNRLYQNRDRYFYGISARVFDYPVGRNYWVSMTTDVWNQPRELEFSTHKSTTGALVSGMVRYKLTKTPTAKRFLTADLGLQYKTFGFVPEEVILEEAFTVRLGMTYTVGNSFNGQ